MPTLSSPMQAAAQAGYNQPFYLVHLDVLGDPLWAWTGRTSVTVTVAGDPLLNAGQTFLPAADIGSISGISHGADGSIQTMTLTLNNADFTDQATGDFVRNIGDWSRRLAVVWIGFTDPAAGTVIASPVRLLTGRMIGVQASDGTRPGIAVKVAGKSAYDGERASAWLLGQAHQEAFYAGDRALEFIPQMVGKELRFGTGDPVSRGLGGTIGRGVQAAGQIRNQ